MYSNANDCFERGSPFFPTGAPVVIPTREQNLSLTMYRFDEGFTELSRISASAPTSRGAAYYLPNRVLCSCWNGRSSPSHRASDSLLLSNSQPGGDCSAGTADGTKAAVG